MKKLEFTKVLANILIVTLVLILTPIGASAAWKQDSKGWWNTEGNSWSVGWKLIDGKWYYFGQDGYMAHDIFIDGYKLGSDGAWIQAAQSSTTGDSNTLKSTSSDKIQSEFTSEGVTMKLEKSIYDLGTKKLNFYIINKSGTIHSSAPTYAVFKFEDNNWHALTQFTTSNDELVIANLNETAEGTISLNIIKGFDKLTPGKYKIVKKIGETYFPMEFELK